MTTPGSAPLLEMKDIDKSFYGVKVLDRVSLDLYAGEVLALLGENGAGKSTLIKILNGDYQKDGGTILIDSKPVAINQPRDAEDLGIRMIYQEQHYAPELSVAENLLIGHLPTRGIMVDWKKAYEQASEQLKLLKVGLDPKKLMMNLTVVERQIVEVVKAISGHARIIVMDEPTAAFPPNEVALLFDAIRNLVKQGIAIIYISHRLDEVFRIADRATVLRDGKLVGTRRIAEITQRDLVQMMVGHDVTRGTSEASIPVSTTGAKPVLNVSGLTREGAFADINLDLVPGEIVGIFGLLGAGHDAIINAIFGEIKPDSGTVAIDGKVVTIANPREARHAGIGLVPADRKVSGLVLDMNVRENVTLSNWGPLSRMGFFQSRAEKQHAQQWIDRLGIRMAGGMATKLRFLSGGNQQKVVLARWLEANVKVLLLNEPTWGVDVGARGDIYKQLEALAAQGLAILLVSSDLDEVLSVSHRILTVYKGQLTGQFSRAEASREKLLHAAAGGTM
ncbi:MAG: sugar ABC transporter ATP-binding protein [Anaerolineae bacterium]|nr:sugar ABC transporter ATP-binding protein [Anaerolineae bacterium]